MRDGDLRIRSKKFFFKTIDTLNDCKYEVRSNEIIKQLTRSSGSVCSNTRAMFRARSTKEYYSKLGIVVEEADECGLWLEALARLQISQKAKLEELKNEANQLTAIFVSLYKRKT
ncbi:MAG: four helix bundle protein [Flavobacteriales bacterium]|nr:four helix bundle protein [Flavobacteriales bacterium]|tara:strand:+ start:1922 stop:2266 length:345 start_codon:yes stop_codon:yes gene_type:complete